MKADELLKIEIYYWLYNYEINFMIKTIKNRLIAAVTVKCKQKRKRKKRRIETSLISFLAI